MNFIGIDPDVTCLTVAIVNLDGQLQDIRAFKSGKTGMEAIREIIPQVGQYIMSDSSFRIEAVAIEGQEIVYTARHGYNPRSLLPLIHVAGAVHALCAMRFPDAEIFVPSPAAWKGQVPKGIHQARTLKKLGIGYVQLGGGTPYCVPACADHFDLNKGDWKHGMDSWSLAIWARDQYNLNKNRSRPL